MVPLVTSSIGDSEVVIHFQEAYARLFLNCYNKEGIQSNLPSYTAMNQGTICAKVYPEGIACGLIPSRRKPNITHSLCRKRKLADSFIPGDRCLRGFNSKRKKMLLDLEQMLSFQSRPLLRGEAKFVSRCIKIRKEMKFYLKLIFHTFTIVKINKLALFKIHCSNVCHGLLKNFHAPAGDRTGDPSIYSLALCHVAIKAGLYRKAVQVYYIPNLTQYNLYANNVKVR